MSIRDNLKNNSEKTIIVEIESIHAANANAGSTIDYPEGFTQENTNVIGIKSLLNDTVWVGSRVNGNEVCDYSLTPVNIVIGLRNAAYASSRYKIMLARSN